MRILMIVPPERKDFYNYLEVDTKNTYILLWHESIKEYNDSGLEIPSFIKEIFFWDQFITPQRLLQYIKPDKIVFFEIIDQRQIALIIQVKKLGLTTFYLEHGAAGDVTTALQRSQEKDAFSMKHTALKFKKMLTSFHAVCRTKYFYYASFKGINNLSSFWKFLTLPLMQLIFGPNKALRKRLFRERVPDYNIVFNQTNFEQFRLYTGINENDALFTGVPMFDVYYGASNGEENYILYIDSPFLENGFMNWTPEYHEDIARRLFNFAENNKIKVYAKLHPRSDKQIWDSYKFDSPYFEILQEGNFPSLYLKSRLILGFASSLITGLLCAKKNIVLLGWHPDKKLSGNDFSQTGLCHISYDINDLDSKFTYWVNNNLTLKNDKEYTNYLKRYNFPFDGKATNRVIESFNKTK